MTSFLDIQPSILTKAKEIKPISLNMGSIINKIAE
jgi:hypothetical protein